MRLSVDALHILLHHIDTSWSFVMLRQTSSILRGIIDETGLKPSKNSKAPPLCRRAECSTCFTLCTMLRQTSEMYEELAQCVPSAVRITLHLSIGDISSPLEEQSLERWSRVCNALSHAAPHLQSVSLRDLTHPASSKTVITVPDNIFARFAPVLRSANILFIGLASGSQGLPVPTAFTGLRYLEYQPPSKCLTAAELTALLASLPQLKALALCLSYIDIDTDPQLTSTEPTPISHRLAALRIDNLRYGENLVFQLFYKSSTTLRRFEARNRVGHWWQRFRPPPERHRELAAGLNFTELDIESANSDSGPQKLRFYHRRGPEKYDLIGANAQWLTRITLHHLLWPEYEPLPEASCLTTIHILMTQCDALVENRLGIPPVQDIFLATKQTAWRVPVLATFSLSYAASPPGDRCTSEHHTCCRRDRMLVSAELLAKLISELFLFEKDRLDDIQLNCIELYEPEIIAMSMLRPLARDIVQSSLPVNTPAVMRVTSRLPPLEV